MKNKDKDYKEQLEPFIYTKAGNKTILESYSESKVKATAKNRS